MNSEGESDATAEGKVKSEATLSGRLHHQLPIEDLMENRIHYGCGGNVKEGWLNVDGFDGSYPYDSIPEDLRKRIVFIDLTRKHPFPDETFSFAYSEHMIEHFDQAESISFLCEAFRTLKKGGVLRLCCPGLEGVLKRHYRSSDFEGAEAGRSEAFDPWGHKHFYCFESLKRVAEHLGFSRIYEVTHAESAYPELQGTESRPAKEDGFELLVEMVK